MQHYKNFLWKKSGQEINEFIFNVNITKKIIEKSKLII